MLEQLIHHSHRPCIDIELANSSVLFYKRTNLAPQSPRGPLSSMSLYNPT